MSRRKFGGENKADLTVTNYDLSPFMPDNSVLTKSISFENESVETLHEKLIIKSEALNLLGKQLELCNKEKNEYKRLIDTLYDKNLSLKKALYFKQQNQIDPEDETFLHLTNSGSLFSSSSTSTSPNTSKNTSRKNHNLLLKSNKSKKSTNLNATGSGSGDVRSTSCLFNDIDSEDYMKILKDLIKTLQKEKSEIIQKYQEAQQELADSKNDLRLLREQIVRQRVGCYIEGLNLNTPPPPLSPPPPPVISPIKLDINAVDLSAYEKRQQQQLSATPQLPTSHSVASALSAFAAANNSAVVKENLIKEIEELREQKNTIENDLRLALCQKEEIEIERDSFKEKYLKLNKFLIDSTSSSTSSETISSSSSNRTDLDNNSNTETSLAVDVDRLDRARISLCVDELISKNKYLSESNRNLREELDMLKVSTKRQQKTSIQPQPQAAQHSQLNMSTAAATHQNRTGAELAAETSAVSKQKVKLVLFRAEQYLAHARHQQHHHYHGDEADELERIELVTDLKNTVDALIEALNDKLIASSHQRKVNKMLAERIQDLEKQLAKIIGLNVSTPSSPSALSNQPKPLSLDEPLIPIKNYDSNKF